MKKYEFYMNIQVYLASAGWFLIIWLLLLFRKQDGVEAELAIINVYCPRVDPDREDRLLYKLRFFALLQTRAEALLQSGW